MEDLALLYIPDISGFTEFMTQTEIDHSQGIISDLIETIINSNTLELKVSDIEGDAVLFYLMGKPPTNCRSGFAASWPGLLAVAEARVALGAAFKPERQKARPQVVSWITSNFFPTP